MFARKVIVPATLLHALRAQFVAAEGATVIEVSGTIAASAQVFREAHAVVNDHVVDVSIYSMFIFWSRKGSPDFKVTIDLPAASGTYELRLIQPDGSAIPWTKLTL